MNEIYFRNVTFSFDKKTIISHFSEHIAAGEHVAIVGKSGAGKSTLLNSVVGLSHPDSGEISVDGLTVNAANIQQIRQKAAWLPQNVHLPYTTVLETLTAPFEWATNKHLVFNKERCLSLFAQVGMDESLFQKDLSALSGGERQRLLLVAIPAAILYHYRTGILGAMFVAVARMIVQLFMVGFYLHYLFEWNNMWVNIAWLLLMTGVCTLDLIKRVRLSFRRLFFPVYFSLLVSLTLISVYFLYAVLAMDNIFDSRYFIPISGILLGNILSSNVIGLNAFYEGLRKEQSFYNYLLCNGATIKEAVRPFQRTAIIKSFNPTIASMAVMGLISLPGTMIGQIIGGSSPDTAIRYQIMIMIIIMAGSILSLALCMKWSVRYILDEFGALR